jgi:hypothetical protein
MNPTVLDHIPVKVEATQVAQRLGFAPDADLAGELEELAAQANRIARPRAVYNASFVEEHTPDLTVIDGVTFKSRVLSVNVSEIHRVFPYVVTCGSELEAWSEGIDDPLTRFHADTIKELALYQASEHLASHLDSLFGLKRAATMNPGSLADWPLSEQLPLFRLLGDVRSLIGVSLGESFLMHPVKSVSGIRFPAESSFESCMLCPREVCPNRRAPHDAALFESRYRGAVIHG